MSEALALADRQAREQALDPHRSILLEAPAGSGKTAVLTQRFLRLLCTVEDAGAVLAITFTRKAAAEMRSRVTGALRGEIAPDDPGAHELRALAGAALRHGAARGWKLAEDPASLRIQTIDSFNYWLASQLPLAARAGGTLTVTEVPEGLYRQAARRTLIAAESDALLAPDTELLFERLDNHWHTLERMLAQMLRQRGHWLRYVLQQEPHLLCARVNASLGDIIRARLAAARRSLPEPLRRAAEALPGVGVLSDEPERLPAWKRLAHLTLSRAGWRQKLSARFLGPEFSSPAPREALARLIGELSRDADSAARLRAVAALPHATFGAGEERALGALSRVLARAAMELQAQFAHARRVDYTYVTGAARAALAEAGEPTELALRTGLALKHILVDEFQDTSLAQFELLETLTAGWEEGDARTLFVVGDAMQSIYRFRDAEVGLFIAARRRGLGRVRLEPLRLARNFRATPPLVGWTNEVFTQLFPRADDLAAGAVAFKASVAARATAQGDVAEAVQLRLFADACAEARAIARRIGNLRSRDAQATVAVLVAAHAHAVPILGALGALGLEALGVDLVPLGERPVVRDLVQLARALYDLADRSAWLAVLRAPWCGVRLTTLTALSAPEPAKLIVETIADPRHLTHCAEGDAAGLARVHEVLMGALEHRDREPPADWLERTWVQLGAPDAYPKADLEDARVFLTALAEQSANGTWEGPEDFAALLENLYSTPSASGTNPVQIMTIHRAKGLEFDHVFVPALDRSLGQTERSLLYWIDLAREDGGSDLLMAPSPVTGEGEESEESLHALIRSLLTTRIAHERMRLMYVAATRARRSLHLSGALALRADGLVRPERDSLLGCLWPVLGTHFRSESEATTAAAPAPQAPQLLRRLAPGWSTPELPAAPALTHLPLARASLAPPEFKWVRETQREVGTLVHALLKRLAGRDSLPSLAEVESLAWEIVRQLERAGVAPPERAAATHLVVTALAHTVADPRGRWILANHHREAQSELALTGITDGRLRSVVIDRSFVDEHGTRWVIDFKTSRHEGGGLEEFLLAELDRYREQLTTYAALASELGPEPVRAALYFPLLGAFRELP